MEVVGVMVGVFLAGFGVLDKVVLDRWRGRDGAVGPIRLRLWWAFVVVGLVVLGVSVRAIGTRLSASADEERLVQVLHERLGGSTDCIRRQVERIDSDQMAVALAMVLPEPFDAEVRRATLDALAATQDCGTDG